MHGRDVGRPTARRLELRRDPQQQVLAAVRRRRAARRSAGRRRSTYSGSEIAGWPVTLETRRERRERAARGRSRPAGRPASAARPSGGGGSPSVGVSSRSKPPSHHSANRRVEPRPARCSASSSSPPVVPRPASAMAHVSGSTSSGVTSRPIVAARSAMQVRGGHRRPDRDETRSALGLVERRRVRVLDVVAERLEQARGRPRPRRRSRRRQRRVVPGIVRHEADAQRRRARCRPRRVTRRGRRRRRRGRRPRARRRRRASAGGVAHRAASRASCTDSGRASSSLIGPTDVRPRDGLSPTSPQHAAGMRIEPPPSLRVRRPAPCPPRPRPPTPPLEPPGVRVEVPRVAASGRTRRGSVVGRRPSSGVLVRPSDHEARRRGSVRARCEVVRRPVARVLAGTACPSVRGSPASAHEVLERGTARRGTARRAASPRGLRHAPGRTVWIDRVELAGSSFSMRRDRGVDQLDGRDLAGRTSSACAVASSPARSSPIGPSSGAADLSPRRPAGGGPPTGRPARAGRRARNRTSSRYAAADELHADRQAVGARRRAAPTSPAGR